MTAPDLSGVVQMGPRDIEVRGWLALIGLPDAIQRAEDSTAECDRRAIKPRGYDRPATSTERILLTHLGYELPDDLTTHVSYPSSIRHRSWPQLETPAPPVNWTLPENQKRRHS
jgi:hypothetical protein